MDHTFWYLTRTAGIVAYMLLFFSVTLGLMMTTGLFDRIVARFRVYDVHRFLSLLTLGVTLFHVFIVLPDEYIGFSVPELLIPFASPYEPLFMALGVVSLYVMIIAIGAFYLRPLVSYPVWRLLHYTTFGVFVLALVHGLGAGTDSDAGWMLWLYTLTGLIVFNLTVYRILRGSARGIEMRPSAPSTLHPAA